MDMSCSVTISGQTVEDVLAQMRLMVGAAQSALNVAVRGHEHVDAPVTPADPDHFDHINEPELPGMNPDQPKRKRRTKAEMEAARMAQADGPKAEPVAAATEEVSAGQAAVPDNTASVPAAPLLAAEGASAEAAVLGNDAGAAAPITLAPDEFRAKIQVWASEGEGRLPLVTGALAKLGVQKVKEVAAADYAGFLAELGVA